MPQAGTDLSARLSRRAVIAAVAAGAAGAAHASSFPVTGDHSVVLPVWAAEPPGGVPAGLHQSVTSRGPDPHERTVDHITSPEMAVFAPNAGAKAGNGAAILLCQGGGYVHIAQSAAVPAALTAAGYTVFDLLYRLPGDGWTAGPDAPFADAVRAIRRIRADAAKYGVDPHRIGVMGFSAGGHVAASLATRFSEPPYRAVDAIDELPARPDFAVLSCPVITMQPPFVHVGSCEQLLGRAPTGPARAAHSCELFVTSATPPCFLVHADDDPVVPADNSLLMVSAFRRAGVPAELHLFREGGHGMGPNLPKTLPASLWPGLFFAWAQKYGFA